LHNNGADTVNDFTGFEDGFAEGSLRNSFGLVSVDELLLLHRLARNPLNSHRKSMNFNSPHTATLLEFAGVHYFTKVGSGEIPAVSDDEGEWENVEEIEEIGGNPNHALVSSRDSPQRLLNLNSRRKNSIICPIYNEAYNSGRISSAGSQSGTHSHLSTMERTTQTEPPRKPKWKQFWLCFVGNDEFRRQRAKEATSGSKKHVNSVSAIDRCARVIFPGEFSSQTLSIFQRFSRRLIEIVLEIVIQIPSNY
jgi:hypothetical protein